MISKRLRYEILRRDGNRCKYCGATSDEVKLTVDHVIPTALGGSDQPDNLVAACADCNAGKTSTSPDSPLIDDVANDALRWGRAMELAAEYEKISQAERERQIQHVVEAWCFDRDLYDRDIPVPHDWRLSIDTFISAGLDYIELMNLTEKAISNTKVSDYGVWKYYCGICWTKIKDRQKLAEKIIQSGGAE